MSTRPLSITIIGWVFIAVGNFAFVYHFSEFVQTFELTRLVVSLIRLLAVLGGVFLLRGFSWARWLLLGWLAFHVIASAFHSAFEVVIHLLLLAVISYFLLRKRATKYFVEGNATN